MQLWCSFCGVADRGPRGRLIAGHYVWICRECVELCNEFLLERPTGDQAPKATEDDIPLTFRRRLSPEEVMESAICKFRGAGLARKELEDVAEAAYRRAVAEFVHSEEPPLQVYARHRIDQEIRHALGTSSPEEGR